MIIKIEKELEIDIQAIANDVIMLLQRYGVENEEDGLIKLVKEIAYEHLTEIHGESDTEQISAESIEAIMNEVLLLIPEEYRTVIDIIFDNDTYTTGHNRAMRYMITELSEINVLSVNSDENLITVQALSMQALKLLQQLSIANCLMITVREL